MLLWGRCWPLLDRLDLGWIFLYLPSCQDVAKERKRGGVKFKFFGLAIQFILQEALKDAGVLQVTWKRSLYHPNIQRTNLFKKSLRTSFTSAWKTARTLVRPNSITRYWKCPSSVLNVVFYLSPFLMQTRWYVLQRSSFVNTVAPWRGSKAEFIRGKGYLFLIVMSFNLR